MRLSWSVFEASSVLSGTLKGGGFRKIGSTHSRTGDIGCFVPILSLLRALVFASMPQIRQLEGLFIL